jgi:hypothetical protein
MSQKTKSIGMRLSGRLADVHGELLRISNQSESDIIRAAIWEFSRNHRKTETIVAAVIGAKVALRKLDAENDDSWDAKRTAFLRKVTVGGETKRATAGGMKGGRK